MPGSGRKVREHKKVGRSKKQYLASGYAAAKFDGGGKLCVSLSEPFHDESAEKLNRELSQF